MKLFYAVLTVLGFVLPMSQFVSWLSEHGFAVQLFILSILEDKLSLFAWFDVIVSAVVLIAFILYEGRRIAMQKLWIPIVATLSIGVSFGLPLFLFLREQHLKHESDL